MNRIRGHFPHHVWFVIAALVLTGCGKTALAQQDEDSANPPTLKNESVLVDAAVLLELELSEEKDQNCIDCHSDKDELINTAAAEEVVEAESSGEG